MIFYTITSTEVTLSIFIDYFIYALIIISGFSIVGILFLHWMFTLLLVNIPSISESYLFKLSLNPLVADDMPSVILFDTYGINRSVV